MERGFLDRDRINYSQMLALTGIELLCIFGTACIQIYFVKSLLDNRAVVWSYLTVYRHVYNH